MTLAEFKGIFWWEWAHRLLARSVGLLFAVPFFAFWIAGKLENRLKLPLLGILLLGGLQGAIGWWMVSSGLAVRTDVSQYRLATHLTLACIIFSAIAWVMRGLGAALRAKRRRRACLIGLGGLMTLLVLLQIYLGGLVAGLDAGLSYNTWPLMDGAIVPGHMFPIHPLWHNFFENPKLVQFIHRMNAYLLWTVALVQMIATLAVAPASRARAAGDALLRRRHRPGGAGDHDAPPSGAARLGAHPPGLGDRRARLRRDALARARRRVSAARRTAGRPARRVSALSRPASGPCSGRPRRRRPCRDCRAGRPG